MCALCRLQEAICSTPENLCIAAQGIKAFTAYAQHKAAQTNNTSQPPNSSCSQLSVPSKQAVPGFDALAESLLSLVSWTVTYHEAQGMPIKLVQENQEVAEPLVEAGYHRGLLTLLGMGYPEV